MEILCLSDIEAAVEQDTFSLTVELEKDENLESEDSLSFERASSDESCLIPNIFNPDQGNLDIAPGEGKQPQSFFTDEFCEEQAFPYLFPTGKCGYKVGRPVHTTPTKYFNQRLLNFSQRFSSNSDYIFFAHYVMQQINLFNQINVATRKVKGDITAGQWQQNFIETVRSFVCEDQAHLFMSSIKGTPAYWKKHLYVVVAMVKQFGLATFFLTLSCANLKWVELIDIISNLNNLKMDNEDLDYFEKCENLNLNPVLIARHFQYRVEVFFKEILLHKKNLIGQVNNYVIKEEFQFRGFPHIHSFRWMVNSPTLSKDNKKEYIEFVDSIIRTDLPHPVDEADLHEFVSKYQIHRHSRTCRKYKNIPCRFNFGKYFSKETIIAEPLPEGMDNSENLLYYHGELKY